MEDKTVKAIGLVLIIAGSLAISMNAGPLVAMGVVAMIVGFDMRMQS